MNNLAQKPAQSLTIQVRPKTIKRLTMWGVVLFALAAIVAIIPAVKSVVTIVIVALFLAFLLDPVVNFMENRGVDRLWAVILVFSFIVFLAALGFKFLSPIIFKEIQEIQLGIENQSPSEIISHLNKKLGSIIPVLASPAVQSELNAKISQALTGFFQKSFSMLVGLFSAVVSMVMVAFITFFFLKDGRRMKKTVISWVPNRYFEMALNIVHKTSSQLGRYIRGQLVVASIVATLCIVALYLLNIRYYFFIGAVAGLANMIPYFGPIVGAVPAIIIALIDTGSFGAVAAVAVAFACIQLFENVFVSPFIVSKSVELHPLTIIIVILIGGQLMGIFGMLLAVPTAGIVKVTAHELYLGLKNYRIL
ncbi:MAG: AI-2E family transporter [bacterium]